MKRVSEWVTLLAVVVSLIFVAIIISSPSVNAQEGDEGRGGGGSFAIGMPLPPEDEFSCGARNGTWSETAGFCRRWDGEEQWAEYLVKDNSITREECEARDGKIVTENTDINNPVAQYYYCRDFNDLDQIIAQAQDEGEATRNEAEVERECNVGATGWFICPVTNMMAGAVDGVYEMLVNFVRIPPITTTGDNAQIYNTWVIFRNFANIVFVLLLLVALISQISNLGMSNYGIKRLLPRVIVAAVLVNISIYLCILAVDISNIIGQSIYNLLTTVSGTIRINITGENGEGAWATVVAAILSGGTVGAIAMISGGAAAISSFGFIILPIVLMAVMAAFTAFIILALRYLLIYLLIAVSPIAFVMYLLPNTAKYFDKWKDIFITILFFYPLFSVLFGAADLVSRMAISSASNTEVGGLGPVMLLFGLFIQVAPLVMSYKLLQTANSVAGTVTNGLQRRGDGFISAAKNRRNKAVGGAMKGSLNRMQNYGAEKGPKSLNPAARTGRMITASRIRRGKTEDQRNAWNSMAERNFLDARNNNEGANQTNYDARAADMSVSEINALQKSNFIKALGQTSDKLDANGNPVYKLDENNNPTGQIVQVPSRYAVIASGNDATAIESITRQARAQQVAEERKTYTAEFSGSAIPQLRNALVEAIQSNNTSKTQALQSLLYSSGGRGVDTVKDIIRDEQTKGPAANQQILSAMSENILANHGDMKSRDNAQMEWAISGQSIDSIVKKPNFGANLSEKDKASQTPDNMREMAKHGNLTGDTAARILDNPNLSINLKDDQRSILEALRDGRTLPLSSQERSENIIAGTPQAPQASTIVNNNTSNSTSYANNSVPNSASNINGSNNNKSYNDLQQASTQTSRNQSKNQSQQPSKPNPSQNWPPTPPNQGPGKP